LKFLFSHFNIFVFQSIKSEDYLAEKKKIDVFRNVYIYHNLENLVFIKRERKTPLRLGSTLLEDSI